MKLITKSLLSCSLGVLAAGASVAQSAAATPQTTTTSPQVLTTLTCTGPALKESVYAYTESLGPSEPALYVSFYVPFSAFNTFLEEEFDLDSISTCSFGDGGGNVLENVKIDDVGVVAVGTNVGTGPVAAGQLYTIITAEFTGLSLGSAKTPPLPTATPEERAKSLAAFKARALTLLK